MKKYTVHTTWGRKLTTWGATHEAAERRIAQDLARAGQGEEVYFSSDAVALPAPRVLRRVF